MANYKKVRCTNSFNRGSFPTFSTIWWSSTWPVSLSPPAGGTPWRSPCHHGTPGWYDSCSPHTHIPKAQHLFYGAASWQRIARDVLTWAGVTFVAATVSGAAGFAAQLELLVSWLCQQNEAKNFQKCFSLSKAIFHANEIENGMVFIDCPMS